MRPDTTCLMQQQQQMLQRRTRQRRPRQRGAAIVEFALLLVPMLVLGFGVAEYGRAIYHYNTTVKSVRSAVRMLSQQNPNDIGYGARVTQAKCLAVFGNIGCTGAPLAPGLALSNVNVCDRVSWGECDAAAQSDYNNVPTGLGTINLVEVRISGYQFSYIGLPLVSIPLGNAVTFGPVGAFMRQTG